MINNILLADDELTFRDTFAAVLCEEGLHVKTVSNGIDAIQAVNNHPYTVVILDIQMPGADGIKVLREIMNIRPETRVIMITAYGTVEMAVEAMKLGACDYVMKPVIFEDILVKIRQQMQFRKLEDENRQLKDELQGKFGIKNIVGNALSLQPVFETIHKVAHTKSNVMVSGESGTGKELVARAIHSMGLTKDERFTAINCSAIPETLLESELFGHKKGSFTSAVADKKGLFEVARGGTLFLDEIGFMSMACQAKLLRAVEEKKILPVGATELVDYDVRLIAATNLNLLEEIKAGRFREDLYYRINVVSIKLPALRERREDIPLLIEHFINKYSNELGKSCQGVTDQAMSFLMQYEWKGNIRELQNVIERAIIFTEGPLIDISDLGHIGPASDTIKESSENLRDALKLFEREHVYRILNKYDRNKNAAASALGVGLSSLYRKIEELGISVESQVRNRQSSYRVVNDGGNH
jgi:DNA-binding NtrC family response regulator